ncbi:rubredoxin [Enorma phocaeensis]|uniref:rubredoxin n=1 Tax=Enorma phocaeensis TaxID=1871019 RepID=UPI000C83B63D|nr:rubredoxin [Enorma phocaeensis]
MRYVCSICGYVYDEEQKGTLFAELPETWTCPLCGAPKALFEPEAAPARRAW